MAYKFDISQGEEILLKAASIGAAVLGIVAVWNFYKNNIWKPRIKILSVDYPNSVAELEINGKPFTLRGDSTYLIAYDWGVRFGFTPKERGARVADRIEIIKRGMVEDILRKVEDVSFTGFDERTFWNDAFEGAKGGLVAVPRSFTGSEQAITKDVWGVKDSDSFSIFEDK